MSDTTRDAIASLPTPDVLRDALARRVREAEVIRRLLRVSEFAETELAEFGEANQPSSESHESEVSHA